MATKVPKGNQTFEPLSLEHQSFKPLDHFIKTFDSALITYIKVFVSFSNTLNLYNYYAYIDSL